MRNILYLAITICLCSLSAFAQEKKQEKAKQSVWERIYIGGGLGAQFGSTTAISVTPQIGYRVTPRFIPGIGITYIYYQYKDPYTHEKFTTDVYGGSVFGKYFITDNLFAHVEYEQLSLEVYDYFLNDVRRVTTPSFMIGGGYSLPVGGRAFLQVVILYDVIQDRYSPYPRNYPVIRIGFGI